MKTNLLSLTMLINVSKRKTILSKNTSVSFATSILVITNIYLVIFVQRLTITKIKLYTTSRRLFNDKLVTKFIIIFFYNFFATSKNRSLLYDL